MKTLIVCESMSRGNTLKVAAAMAKELGAEVKRPSEVDPKGLDDYELIGFGSGIYNMNVHKDLLALARNMLPAKNAAFVFSTSGAFSNQAKRHGPLKELLASKGVRVLGDFNCKGSHGPELGFLTINKGRPNEEDLAEAQKFASLMAAACHH